MVKLGFAWLCLCWTGYTHHHGYGSWITRPLKAEGLVKTPKMPFRVCSVWLDPAVCTAPPVVYGQVYPVVAPWQDAHHQFGTMVHTGTHTPRPSILLNSIKSDKIGQHPENRVAK